MHVLYFLHRNLRAEKQALKVTDVDAAWYTQSKKLEYLDKINISLNGLQLPCQDNVCLLSVFALKPLIFPEFVNMMETPTWRKHNKPSRDKTNKMAGAPSEDSDQPGHLPSLIRVFTVRMKKAWTLNLSPQRRL